MQYFKKLYIFFILPLIMLISACDHDVSEPPPTGNPTGSNYNVNITILKSDGGSAGTGLIVLRNGAAIVGSKAIVEGTSSVNYLVSTDVVSGLQANITLAGYQDVQTSSIGKQNKDVNVIMQKDGSGGVITTFGTAPINGVKFLGGTFYAYGENGSIAYSASGRLESGGGTWNALNTTGIAFGAEGIKDLVLADNTMVAAGGSKVAHSLNFSAGSPTWIMVDSPLGGAVINGMASKGGTVVAVGDNGKIGYSINKGVSWSVIPTDVFGGRKVISITATDGKGFAAISEEGGVMALSSTGTSSSWLVGTISAFKSDTLKAITTNGGTCYVIGSGGKSYKIHSFDNTTVQSDASWKKNITISDGMNVLLWGNGVFLTAGQNGTLAYTDGTTQNTAAVWTVFLYNAFQHNNEGINGAAFGNDRFVMVGHKGSIYDFVLP